jgi:outer membrane lipoprotein-sorting protein
MKIKQLLLFVFAIGITATQAQTADEIISKYIENSGGYDKWAKVESMRYTTKLNQGGMELPFVLIQMKDGRQGQIITFQGKEIKQGMFDGTNLWSSNPMADKTERSDAESTENLKANLGGDFPIAFFDYKKRGYKVELMGKETVEGTETFKIKLTKNPVKEDGKPKESVAYYFFDTENFIPLLSEEEITSGPAKGMIAISKFSDYQEVNGLMLAYSMAAGVKGQPTQTINFTSIEINPTIDPSIFVMPAQK